MTRGLASLIVVSASFGSVACGSSGNGAISNDNPSLQSNQNTYQRPFSSSQQPTDNQQAPTSTSTVPLNPNAPSVNPNQPTPFEPPQSTLISCTDLCQYSTMCLADCLNECGDVYDFAVDCPVEALAVLACVQAVGVVCENDQRADLSPEACAPVSDALDACWNRLHPEPVCQGIDQSCSTDGECCSGLCDTTTFTCF